MPLSFHSQETIDDEKTRRPERKQMPRLRKMVQNIGWAWPSLHMATKEAWSSMLGKSGTQMTKPTPGPWIADIDGRVMLTTGIHRKVAEAHAPDEPHVDDGTDNCDNYWEKVVANARLIAAAPDLLVVAKAVVELMERLYPTAAESADMGGLESALLFGARAAIAKAEGGGG